MGKNSNALYNTGLLLHALGSGLRAHIEQGVMSTEELEEMEILALMQDLDPDIQIAAIKRSKTRTILFLVHTERLFAAWEQSSHNGEHRMRRKIIREWYFNKLELPQIAQKLGRTEGIILTQLGIALDQISVYFFGEEGLSRAMITPIPEGATIKISIKFLSDEHEAAVREWLDRGELRSIGQWRNSGKGQFVWMESQ